MLLLAVGGASAAATCLLPNGYQVAGAAACNFVDQVVFPAVNTYGCDPAATAIAAALADSTKWSCAPGFTSTGTVTAGVGAGCTGGNALGATPLMAWATTAPAGCVPLCFLPAGFQIAATPACTVGGAGCPSSTLAVGTTLSCLSNYLPSTGTNFITAGAFTNGNGGANDCAVVISTKIVPVGVCDGAAPGPGSPWTVAGCGGGNKNPLTSWLALPAAMGITGTCTPLCMLPANITFAAAVTTPANIQNCNFNGTGCVATTLTPAVLLTVTCATNYAGTPVFVGSPTCTITPPSTAPGTFTWPSATGCKPLCKLPTGYNATDVACTNGTGCLSAAGLICSSGYTSAGTPTATTCATGGANWTITGGNCTPTITTCTLPANYTSTSTACNNGQAGCSVATLTASTVTCTTGFGPGPAVVTSAACAVTGQAGGFTGVSGCTAIQTPTTCATALSSSNCSTAPVAVGTTCYCNACPAGQAFSAGGVATCAVNATGQSGYSPSTVTCACSSPSGPIAPCCLFSSTSATPNCCDPYASTDAAPCVFCGTRARDAITKGGKVVQPAQCPGLVLTNYADACQCLLNLGLGPGSFSNGAKPPVITPCPTSTSKKGLLGLLGLLGLIPLFLLLLLCICCLLRRKKRRGAPMMVGQQAAIPAPPPPPIADFAAVPMGPPGIPPHIHP